ncbi:MAG: carboxypeptidase-like regulatory domain-containing protein [Gemmatimonadaceae bacterium]
MTPVNPGRPRSARRNTLPWAFLGLVLVATNGAWRVGGAQTAPVRAEVIEGRATLDGVVPIPQVTVVATRAPDRATFQAITDSAGRYRIIIPSGTGDYLVHFTRIGYSPVRVRITRTGADSIYTVNAKLPRIAVLDAVEVQASRGKPARGAEIGPQAGASEQIAEGLSGALSPELEGSLAAIAANMPGIMTTADGGVSVFGLGSGANSVTLNGLAFSGTDIPRDAAVQTKVATSAFDPSRGWFAGAQTTIELRPGGLLAYRNAHVTADAPMLQYGDPISAKLGQRLAKVDASIGGNGPLGNRLLYNYAAQGSRSAADESSILTADPSLLQHAGISGDSVERLQQILSSAGIPAAGSVAAPRRVNESLSFIARFDDSPFDWNSPGTKPVTVKALTVYGKLGRTNGLALSPTSTIGRGAENRQGAGMVQGLYSTYIRGADLLETRSALSFADNRTSPYLRLPGGTVLVGSDFADGISGVANVGFGGNDALAADTRRWTWETATSLQGYAPTSASHRLRIDADLRLDGFAQVPGSDASGTFAFNSLADVALGQPAEFTRTLNTPTRNASEWNGFVSLGDQWRVTPRLSLLYGARIEGNAFNTVPQYNPAVDRALGVRTDRAPDTWAVSPRLGFSWVPHRGNPGRMETPLGRFTVLPTTTFHGGVGMFRSMLQPALLAPATTTTGLANGAQSITCLGDATPIPDWRAYAASNAAIPSTCAGGVSNSPFADGAPEVVTFDRSYTAARSWRGTLGVSSAVKNVIFGLDAAYSLNLSQPSVLDVNFRGVPQFLTGNEQRPVFVPESAVVPSSGAVSSVPARIDPAFSDVTNNVSDLRSRSRQLTLSASPAYTFFDPESIWSHLYLSAAYTLSDVRAQRRGFDGATFGDPSVVEWARGDLNVRHSFLGSVGVIVGGATVTLYGKLSSGLPFTPMVARDVNGDGQANDRAFIFNPATTPESNVAASLKNLLANAPASIRSCLGRQLGEVAARNSCEGPWTSAMNVRIALSGETLRLPGSVTTVALNLTNPLGGLDQALHGSAHLRGWGTQAAIDPVLYDVRGFDASQRSFAYFVNPRFGTTSPTLSTLRAPFRITLDVAMTLGRPVEAQMLDRWLEPGRGSKTSPKLSEADLVRRYTRTVPDPYNQIIREADSLLLSKDQVAQLRTAQAPYQQRMSAHWGVLAQYLANLPDAYDKDAAFKRQENMTDEAWAIAWSSIHETLPGILNPVQLKMLPELVATLWYARSAPTDIRILSPRG